VKLHVDALRRCAAAQQVREPGAKGTLKMAWIIQQDGSPRDVRCLTPGLSCVGGAKVPGGAGAQAHRRWREEDLGL
jgi:hypothetical protein